MRSLYAEYVAKKREFESLAGKQLVADSYVELIQEVSELGKTKPTLERAGGELLDLYQRCSNTEGVTAEDIQAILYEVLRSDMNSLPRADRIAFSNKSRIINLDWTNNAHSSLSISGSGTVAKAEQDIREKYAAAKISVVKDYQTLEAGLQASVVPLTVTRQEAIEKIEESQKSLTVDQFKNAIFDKMKGIEITLKVQENQRKKAEEAQSYCIDILIDGRGSKYPAEKELTQKLVDDICGKLLRQSSKKTSPANSVIGSVSDEPAGTDKQSNLGRDDSQKSNKSDATTGSAATTDTAHADSPVFEAEAAIEEDAVADSNDNFQVLEINKAPRADDLQLLIKPERRVDGASKGKNAAAKEMSQEEIGDLISNMYAAIEHNTTDTFKKIIGPVYEYLSAQSMGCEDSAGYCKTEEYNDLCALSELITTLCQQTDDALVFSQNAQVEAVEKFKNGLSEKSKAVIAMPAIVAGAYDQAGVEESSLQENGPSFADLIEQLEACSGQLQMHNQTDANKNIGDLVAQATAELRKPLDKMLAKNTDADVSQRDE